MIKKTLITILILAAVGFSVKSCMAILPKSNMRPSDYDIGLTYDKASAQDKPVVAVFYADWCTYCVKFMPKLDKVRNIYRDDISVVLVDVENPKNQAIVKEYKISAFPTVYIIDPKYDYRAHIDSPYLNSVESLGNEVQKYVNLRKLIKKGDSCSNQTN